MAKKKKMDSTSDIIKEEHKFNDELQKQWDTQNRKDLVNNRFRIADSEVLVNQRIPEMDPETWETITKHAGSIKEIGERIEKTGEGTSGCNDSTKLFRKTESGKQLELTKEYASCMSFGNKIAEYKHSGMAKDRIAARGRRLMNPNESQAEYMTALSEVLGKDAVPGSNTADSQISAPAHGQGAVFSPCQCGDGSVDSNILTIDERVVAKQKEEEDYYFTVMNKCMNTYRQKNHDYSCKGRSAFDSGWDALGPKSLWLRLNDKFQRFSAAVLDGKEMKVSDEKVEDTLMDMINYCAMGLKRMHADRVNTTGGTIVAQTKIDLPDWEELK